MIQAVAAVALVVISAWPAAALAEAIDGDRVMIIDGDTVALPCAVPAKGPWPSRSRPKGWARRRSLQAV